MQTQLLEELHLHLCLLQKHPVGTGQSAGSLQGLWAASLGELPGSFSDPINSKSVNFKYHYQREAGSAALWIFPLSTLHVSSFGFFFFNQQNTSEIIIKNTVGFGSQRRCCCPLQNLLLCVAAEVWVAVVTDSSIRACNSLS